MKKSKLTILYPKHNLQKQKGISIFFISFVLLVVSFSTILIASDQSKTSANFIEKGVTSLGKKIFQRNKASTDNVEVKLKPRASAAHPQAPKTRPKPKTTKTTTPTKTKATTSKNKKIVEKVDKDTVRITDGVGSRTISRSEVQNYTLNWNKPRMTTRDGDIVTASQRLRADDITEFYKKHPDFTKNGVHLKKVRNEYDAVIKRSNYKEKGCKQSCAPRMSIQLKNGDKNNNIAAKADVNTITDTVDRITITGSGLVPKGRKFVITKEQLAQRPRVSIVQDYDGKLKTIKINPNGDIFVDGHKIDATGQKAYEKLLKQISGSSSGKPPTKTVKTINDSNPQKQLNPGEIQKQLPPGSKVDDASTRTANWKDRKKALLAIATTATALYVVDQATEVNNTTQANDVSDHLNSQEGAKEVKKQREELARRAKADAKKNPSTRLPSHVYAKEVNTVVFNNSELTGTPSPKKNKKDKDVKENGNIVVITYADRERQEADGTFNGRIGNVKVKVKRTSGENDCSNRKKSEGKTNNVRYKKDGKTLIKGTINYRTCNTGKYKVELVGKDGYTAVGKTSEECKIEDDQTCVVKFVLKKNGDPDPVVDSNGTVDQNNKDEGITQEL